MAIAGIVLAVIGIGLAIESLSDDEPEIGDITLTLDDPGDIHVGDQRTVQVEIEASFGYIHGGDKGVIDVEAFLGNESIGSESDSYTKSDLGGHNEGRFTYEFDFEAIDTGVEDIKVSVKVTGDKNHVFWSDDRVTVRDDEIRTVNVEFPFTQDGNGWIGSLDPSNLSINHRECPDQDLFLINLSEDDGDVRSCYLADKTIHNRAIREGDDNGVETTLVTAPVSHDAVGHVDGQPFYSAWGIDKARILLDSSDGSWEYSGEEHTGPGQNWCTGGPIDCDPSLEDIYEVIRYIISLFTIDRISYSRAVGPAPNVNVRLINDATSDTLFTTTDSNGQFSVSRNLGPTVSLELGFGDPLLVPRYLDSLSVALFDPNVQPQISPTVMASKIPQIAGDLVDQYGNGLKGWIYVLDPELGEYVQVAYADSSFDFTGEDLGFFGYPNASLRFDLDVGRNRHYSTTSTTLAVPTDAGVQNLSVVFTELPPTANPEVLFQGQFMVETYLGGLAPVAGLIIQIDGGPGTVTGADGSFAFNVPTGWHGISYPNSDELYLEPPAEAVEVVEFGRGGDTLDVGTQVLQYVAGVGVPDFDPQGALPLALTFQNPFRSGGEIQLNLGISGHLRVDIYNAAGRLVRHLNSNDRESGPTMLTWDGRNDAGGRLSEGVYFCRAELSGQTVTAKLVLIH